MRTKVVVALGMVTVSWGQKIDAVPAISFGGRGEYAPAENGVGQHRCFRVADAQRGKRPVVTIPPSTGSRVQRDGCKGSSGVESVSAARLVP